MRTEGYVAMSLRETYSQLSDEQVTRLAMEEAQGLTPEAVDVLKAELRRRQLDDRLAEVIEIQQRELEPEEHRELIESFRKLPCPICKSVGRSLNAIRVATAQSFLVMTTVQKRVVVGCPECLLAAARNAKRHTLAFAWWGIPWGPIRGFQALSINAKATSAAKRQEATAELYSYVTANRGAVVFLVQQGGRVV